MSAPIPKTNLPAYHAMFPYLRNAYDKFIEDLYQEEQTSGTVDIQYGALAEWCDQLKISLIPNVDYDQKSQAEQTEYIMKLGLHGLPVVGNNAAVAPNNQAPVNVSGTHTPATIMNYMMGSQNPRTNEFFAHILSKYSTMDMDEFIRHMTAITSTFQKQQRGVPIGMPVPLTLFEFNQWVQNNRGEVLQVGQLRLWKLIARAGVAWELKKDKIDPLTHLQFDHNGKTLYCYAKNTIHTREGDDHLATREAYTNQFLEGLKTKGKQLAFKEVTPHALSFAHAYFTMFKPIKQKNLVAFGMIPRLNDKVQVPTYSKPVCDAFDKLLKLVNSQPLMGTDYDEVVEKIGWLAMKTFTTIELESFYTDITAGYKSSIGLWASATALFDKISKQNANTKITELKSNFGITATAYGACAALDKARKTRNVSEEARMLNQQTGSPLAHDFDASYDTTMKGHHIVDALTTDLRVKATKDTKISVYGVAYGHMSRELLALRHADAPANSMMFYDVTKAPGSTEIFTKGDVWLHERPGWVIDDTNSHKLSQALSMNATYKNGDMYKINKFLLAGSPVIVSKVTMESFKDRELVDKWKDLLITNHKCHMVRVLKFGKLHNAEVFMVILKDDPSGAHVVTEWGHISADISNCAIAMEMGNILITAAQSRGVRLQSVYQLTKDKVTKYTPDPTIKDEALADGYQAQLFDIRSMWFLLLRSLPIQWSWYVRNYQAGAYSAAATNVGGEIEDDAGNAPIFSDDKVDLSIYDNLIDMKALNINWANAS